MATALAVQNEAQMMESVLIGGDLSKLTPSQRVMYYQKVCESIGLNPLTKPFDYINLNGKLTLYAKKDAADQLRKLHGVSIDDIDIKEVDDQYIVKVKGHDNTGRADVELAVVKKNSMQGDTANAQMKAVTKAKRRLTLSICGLGWLDETEVQTIPDAAPVVVTETGEIVTQEEQPGPVKPAEVVEPLRMINPLGNDQVAWAALQWNISKGDAAKAIGGKKLPKLMEEAEFKSIVLRGGDLGI